MSPSLPEATRLRADETDLEKSRLCETPSFDPGVTGGGDHGGGLGVVESHWLLHEYVDSSPHCSDGNLGMTERRSAHEHHIGLAVEKVRRLGQGGRLVLLRHGACPFVVSIRYPDQRHLVETLQDGQVTIGGNPARADDTDLQLSHGACRSRPRRIAGWQLQWTPS